MSSLPHQRGPRFPRISDILGQDQEDTNPDSTPVRPSTTISGSASVRIKRNASVELVGVTSTEYFSREQNLPPTLDHEPFPRMQGPERAVRRPLSSFDSASDAGSSASSSRSRRSSSTLLREIHALHGTPYHIQAIQDTLLDLSLPEQSVWVTRATVREQQAQRQGQAYVRKDLNLRTMIEDAWSVKNIEAPERGQNARSSRPNPAHDELEHEVEDDNDAIAVAGNPNSRYAGRITAHFDRLRMRKSKHHERRQPEDIEDFSGMDFETDGGLSDIDETEGHTGEDDGIGEEATNEENHESDNDNDYDPSHTARQSLSKAPFAPQKVDYRKVSSSAELKRENAATIALREKWHEHNERARYLLDKGDFNDTSCSSSPKDVSAMCPFEVCDGVRVYKPSASVFRRFEKFLRWVERASGREQGVVKIIVPAACLQKCSDALQTLLTPAPHMTGLVDHESGHETYLHAWKLALTPRDDKPTMYHLDWTEKVGVTAREWRRTMQEDEELAAVGKGDDEPTSERQFIADYEAFQGWGAEFTTGKPATKSLRHTLGCEAPNLSECRGNILQATSKTIAGVTVPAFQISLHGQQALPLQVERYGSYSLKYLHAGASRTWTVVVPQHFKRLQDYLFEFLDPAKNTHGIFVGIHEQAPPACSQFVRHKEIYIPEWSFKEMGIRHTQLTQRPGELVIIFPYAYHQAYNNGPNILESMAYGNRRSEIFLREGLYHECGQRGKCPRHTLDEELPIKAILAHPSRKSQAKSHGSHLSLSTAHAQVDTERPRSDDFALQNHGAAARAKQSTQGRSRASSPARLDVARSPSTQLPLGRSLHNHTAPAHILEKRTPGLDLRAPDAPHARSTERKENGMPLSPNKHRSKAKRDVTPPTPPSAKRGTGWAPRGTTSSFDDHPMSKAFGRENADQPAGPANSIRPVNRRLTNHRVAGKRRDSF